MLCESTIRVNEILGTTIHTREAVIQLLDLLKKSPDSKIELDFSEVSYISRSFADQFYADKMKLMSEEKKDIIVTNANEEVINMLHAVAQTQNKSFRGYSTFPVYKYSTLNQLDNFLLSI